jgi:tetratricopeptide (TPR) repeat protein
MLVVLLVLWLPGSAGTGPPPMTGLFNIVLAPFRWSGPGAAAEVAPRLQAAIRGELRAWSARTPSARLRGPERIGSVGGQSDFMRVAARHGADVVLRPDFRTAGGRLTVTIEIYIGERTLDETPEFAGLHTLAITEPADVVDRDVRLNEQFAASTAQYLDAVVAFVRGLGAYGRGDLTDAELLFRQADSVLTAVERTPGSHRIHREVVLLMLGNTIGGADPARAAEYFRRAVAEAPGYRRAQTGLAETTRATATCRPGSADRDRLEQAIGYYRSALAGAGDDPAQRLFLDMKARLGLGLAYQCRGLAGGAPGWEPSEAEFAEVLRLHRSTPLTGGAARQARWFAAEARAGQALNALAGGRPEAAATGYEQALAMLAGMDVVRPAYLQREIVLLRNLRDTYTRLGRVADATRTGQRITAVEASRARSG